MYNPVKVEAVYPDGTVMLRNAFVMQNAACKGGDPEWSRDRLIKLANTTLSRWNDGYPHHPAMLRVAR